MLWICFSLVEDVGAGGKRIGARLSIIGVFGVGVR